MRGRYLPQKHYIYFYYKTLKHEKTSNPFLIFSFGSDKCFLWTTVDTLQVPSVAMNKIYKAAVVLPNSYAKSKVGFPVLYLLHGAYGHYNDWHKTLIYQINII
jgi:hypothetical protein